jgi:predicted metal-dependent hydrolase
MYESIFIAMIIIFIYIHLFSNQNNLRYISAYTGEHFTVYADTPENEKTKANLLATIVGNMYKLKKHLIENIKNFSDYEEYITQLNQNFNPSRTQVLETNFDSDLTSFSVNKGEEVSFCLKSKKTKQIHDLNLMMYVAVHEMSHFACPDIGHGETFKKIFKKFIEESIIIGIYTKVDFASNPVEYCGMILSSSIV